MSSYRYIEPKTLLSAVVAAPTNSSVLNIKTISNAAFLINVGAGLTATFQLMVSMDGANFYDSGQVIDPVAGSASIIPVNVSGMGFAYIMIAVTPSAGSATVIITGSAKS